MRYFLWLFTFAVNPLLTYAQRTEYAVQVGSGLFFYGGLGATRETYLEISDTQLPNFLGNPYGRTSGLSYGLTAQAQHVTKGRFVYGMQAGFESLTSRIAITLVTGAFFIDTSAGSHVTLRNQFINLHPFLGKRFGNQHISLDATLGVDLGISLAERLITDIQLRGSRYTTHDDRPAPAVDIRPRLNLTGYYRSFGLSLGYSYGLTTYQNYPRDEAPIHTRMWRIGVVYRLAKQV